jgi:peptidyl-prolyl cis-trans isomerase SurA
MLKKIVTSLLCMIAIINSGFCQSQLVDKVVAKIGSEYILLSEVEEEYAYAKSKDPSITDNIKCTIIDNMIANKLVVYHAKVDSVEITDEDVETQLSYRFDAILQQMNGDESFFEEYYGATVEQMKDRYRDDQRQKILADKMQYKLMSEIDITPKEVEKFYNNLHIDSLPYFKSELEISEIVMIPLVNDVERKKALDKITDLRNKIVSGEMTLGAVATKHSQDPGSALREGDLGFTKRGSYVAEFEAAVFSLAKDEISEPIETKFGFHIIQLIERRGNSVRARHVLIKPEITSEDLAKTKNKLDSVRTLIATDSMKFEAAVRKYSDKETPSYSFSGRVKNQNTNNTFFAADDLDPDTYFAVFDLKPNQISKVLEIQMPTGEKAFRLVQLNSKSKPHKASIQEDFDKLTDFAKNSKKNEFFIEWLHNKRKETYIKIDDMFAGCNNLKQ